MKKQYRLTKAVATLIFFLSLFPLALFAEEDAHYIQPDDFFVSREEYKDQTYINVYIAKELTPASPTKTKGEGEFLQVTDGKKLWTKNFYLTRIATDKDLKIGTNVIMFDMGTEDGYRPPQSKDEARTGNWFLAKITDVSDMFKGIITVSGGYKIQKEAVRVILPKATVTPKGGK
ncbi:hypothetical protein ACE5IS_19135 [Leptospira wolffii]|uniref:Uncharacterized protein n=1 Tax=Leptospira wolffii TaxID=409998 RepID=A0A2M9Z999_9LEPT|nr:hypothetical protein [Leptospira wolffii]PJZ65016.1 hypothetical protein CH371_16090 [Leptospira wolffii]TGK58079.1 hypothetical protein EHQ32_12320 [Leptospira wolffii]TGK68758.1 hypothetical protein EHQ35_18190 [Leptospira wolffii]TGK76402.1 hypothetical protein EHQ27_04950 [Leptospira wolffii]TGL27110.1 hypothetical protein EHQ57_16170 [Leptospira wolffii]